MDEVFQALGGRSSRPVSIESADVSSNPHKTTLPTSPVNAAVSPSYIQKVLEDGLVKAKSSAAAESHRCLSNSMTEIKALQCNSTLELASGSSAPVLLPSKGDDATVCRDVVQPNHSPKTLLKKKGSSSQRSDCRSVSPSSIRAQPNVGSMGNSSLSHSSISRNTSDRLGVGKNSWETPRVRRDPAKRAHSKGERTAHRSLDNQLQQQNDSPIPSLSSSSDFLLNGVRASGQFTSSSSSSLPAKSGFDELCSKPMRPSSFINTAKVPMEASADCETNILRSFGKAAMSRFRASIGARGQKEEMPQTNLNINTHFFDRLREQELEKARLGNSDDDEEGKLSSSLECSGDVDDSIRSSRIDHCQLAVAADSDTSGFSSVVAVSPCDNSFQCPTSHLADNDDDASFLSYNRGSKKKCIIPQIEVTALSSRSVESQDSSSHESVTSTATQPSDEGVYSDDSVAATSDHDQALLVTDFHSRKRPVSPINAAALSLTVDQLGFNDHSDAFWTRKVNFFSGINKKMGHFENVSPRYGCAYVH